MHAPAATLPLVVHPNTTPAPALTLSAGGERTDRGLRFTWEMSGDLATVVRPQTETPGRRDGLWEHTCFEAFWSGGDDAYTELNVSPAGDWATYRFGSYRSEPEPAAEKVEAIDVVCRGDFWVVRAEVHGVEAQELELALTAVVETVSGERSYWALAHPGSEPDFHARGGFTARVAARVSA